MSDERGLGSGIVGVRSGGAYAVELKGTGAPHLARVLSSIARNGNDIQNMNSIGYLIAVTCKTCGCILSFC